MGAMRNQNEDELVSHMHSSTWPQTILSILLYKPGNFCQGLVQTKRSEKTLLRSSQSKEKDWDGDMRFKDKVTDFMSLGLFNWQRNQIKMFLGVQFGLI